MTENEAKVLLCQMYLPQFDEEEKQALTIAIKALEEIQQYRAIGTVEEIQSTKERLLLSRDMCKDYYAIGTIEEFKALKEKSEPKKTNSFSGCIHNNTEQDWDFAK